MCEVSLDNDEQELLESLLGDRRKKPNDLFFLLQNWRCYKQFWETVFSLTPPPPPTNLTKNNCLEICAIFNRSTRGLIYAIA